jgi:hypothetical protein
MIKLYKNDGKEKILLNVLNDNTGTCTYHDGFVYDNLSLELTKYTPSTLQKF